MINFENNKLDIFFHRVSSNQQSLDMQIAAAEPYMKDLDRTRCEVLVEMGVSANKTPMSKRPVLQKLLKLVSEGKVRTIYVYDRSRLARNFYEYMAIVTLLHQQGIKVVFTTTELTYQTFSTDLRVEGLYAIIADEEGQNIARRLDDYHSLTPNRKFGYVVHKDNGHRYTINTEVSKQLSNMFDELKNVYNHETFLKFLNHNTRTLKKTATAIVHIIQDSFYAGYSKKGEIYTKLPYVEPYMSLEEFKAIQSSLSNVINVLLKEINDTQLDDFHAPYCGNCNEEMTFKPAILQKESFYFCKTCSSSKSRRIAAKLYNKQILSIVQLMLKHLKVDALTKHIFGHLTAQKKQLTLEIDKLEHLRKMKQHEIVLLKDMKEMTSIGDEIEQLEDKVFKLQKTKLDYELYESSVRKMMEIPQESLLKSRNELIWLTPFFLGKVTIDKDTLDLEYFYNEYIENDNFVKELYDNKSEFSEK